MYILEKFTAGQTKTFKFPGNFFRLKSLSGVTSNSIDVVFFLAGQRIDADLSDIDVGDKVNLPGGFDEVSITSSELQTVGFQTLKTAGGEFSSDRIQGEVSVIDGEERRSRAGVSFLANCYSPAVAGQYSHVQLWNPPASGKILIVKRCWFVGVAAQSYYLMRHVAALASAHSVLHPVSKLLGGAASIAENRYQANAAVLGSYDGNVLPLVLTDFSQPYAVPAGFGLMIVCSTVNSGITSVLEYSEVNA